MPSRSGPVHVVTTSRRYKGKLYQTHLLRRSYREGGKVKNETVGNLSHLPPHLVALIRSSLHGETHTVTNQASDFEIIDSFHHGHVHAVRATMKQLGFENLIAARPSRERNLVLAMVAARIVNPFSKLATRRWWNTTTLGEDLGIADAGVDELYLAMDWLLARQGKIEKKLAARHLDEDGLALYDLSSSYFEGVTCPLAALGHSRDGKKGMLQVNYGLLTNSRGCPVSVSAYSGNTADPTTLVPEVKKVKREFGLKEFVIVGDRGMIGQKQIDQLKDIEGLAWIAALKSVQIRKLVEHGSIQLGLFDERNLIEILHPDYPGERLVVCRNPLMADRRVRSRESLIDATKKELEKVQAMVARGDLVGQDEIGVRVGLVVNKYKVRKHFALNIQDASFSFELRQDKIAAESALDGIYVIRTSLPKERLDAPSAVRSYKMLSGVERAFRSFKTIDLKVRPIHHHLEDRVRSHIFLCMLAFYVEWHMLEAWRGRLFSDEDLQAKQTRDPVAPAKRSAKTLIKVHSQTLEDGSEVHSFRSLLADLSTIVRNVCRRKDATKDEPTFTITTTPSAEQQQALNLIEAITV